MKPRQTHTEKRSLGCRVSDETSHTIGAADRTARGTFWYDLSTRRPFAAAMKRGIDIAASLLLIVVLAPLFLAIMLVRGLAAHRPAVVAQRGVGFRGSEFDMYAFRTGRSDRSNLDAMPRLFNVLEGTMSIVGPHPLLTSDLEPLAVGGAPRRFSVRPGLTGLWRFAGDGASEAELLHLDRDYVNRWSLALDLRIIARTILSFRP